MKAMVQALAVTVSDGVVGHMWRQTGAFLDVAIPVIVFVVILAAGISVVFGLVH